MYLQAMSVLDYIIHQQSFGHLGILLPTHRWDARAILPICPEPPGTRFIAVVMP